MKDREKAELTWWLLVFVLPTLVLLIGLGLLLTECDILGGGRAE